MVEMATQTEPNSNEYLEMANHAKSLVDKADKKSDLLQEENSELKKLLLSCYGVVRMIDEMNETDYDLPGELSMTLEVLRGYLSNHVERWLK